MSAAALLVLSHVSAAMIGGVLGYLVARKRLRQTPRHRMFRMR